MCIILSALIFSKHFQYSELHVVQQQRLHVTRIKTEQLCFAPVSLPVTCWCVFPVGKYQRHVAAFIHGVLSTGQGCSLKFKRFWSPDNLSVYLYLSLMFKSGVVRFLKEKWNYGYYSEAANVDIGKPVWLFLLAVKVEPRSDITLCVSGYLRRNVHRKVF